ncbi:MAG: NAD(P)-dependent oxidoreductase [Alphaproteobacteria bacterium]|nr:NAD(P)-dependent oxidoreductase [Alphaproteobacteria bacterium]
MTFRVVITGAAGLVGQNLIPRLKDDPRLELVALDKHAGNMDVLRHMHPGVTAVTADLADPGPWEDIVRSADAIVCLHAQIGGINDAIFARNNVEATQRVIAAAREGRCSYIVHASSSVLNSKAHDIYIVTKKAQEELIRNSGIAHAVLRPTLMFGWFDRKHLGWLKRFMERTPVFPIPGDGRYLRQPLYAGDFSAIVASCLTRRIEGLYEITGRERVDFIDLIRIVREESGLSTPILKIPYWLFDGLLRLYALFDRDPPFTSAQLKALATPDVFEVIDWPGIFGVTPTPLREAIRRTFRDPVYSAIVLEFG